MAQFTMVNAVGDPTSTPRVLASYASGTYAFKERNSTTSVQAVSDVVQFFSLSYKDATGRTQNLNLTPNYSTARSFFVKKDGSSLKTITIAIRFVAGDYAKISNMTKLTIRGTSGDSYIINIVRVPVLELVSSSEFASNPFSIYFADRVVSAAIRELANNKFALDYVINAPLSDTYVVIKEIQNIVGKVVAEFPHKLTSVSGTIEFTGSFATDDAVNVIFSREPFVTYGTSFSSETSVNGVAVIPPVMPPILPENPPMATPERVRIAIDGVRLNVAESQYECHVSFVPSTLSVGIVKIQTYSSLITNPTNRQGHTVTARTDDDFYEITILDGEERHLYVRLERTGEDDIITPTVIIKRIGTTIEIELPNLIIPIVKLLNIFATDVAANSITFRMQDDLLLTDKIEEIQIRYTGTLGEHVEIIRNPQQQDYLVATVTDVIPETTYAFSFDAKVNGTVTELTTINVSTVAALPAAPTEAQKQKYAVDRIICESLPDDKAKQLMLLPFDLQTEFVKDILSYRTITDGLYFGFDFNPNNFSHGYTKKTASTGFSSEVNVVAKALVSAELLLIPEPHEDTDLTAEPY